MKWLKLAWLKKYFDTGYSVTGYFKYLAVLIGIDGSLGKWLIPVFLAYGLSCFLVGYLWIKWKIADAESEVGNRINPFMHEVRSKLHVKPKR